MLLLTFFSENKQKNHKSSSGRGEDLEEGYHYEGLGDLSPNYLVIAKKFASLINVKRKIQFRNPIIGKNKNGKQKHPNKAPNKSKE